MKISRTHHVTKKGTVKKNPLKKNKVIKLTSRQKLNLERAWQFGFEYYLQEGFSEDVAARKADKDVKEDYLQILKE